MTLQGFEQFVEARSEWFRGYNPESLSALECAERQLEVTFPASLKWLLTHYGYWRATGVGALPFVISTTLTCRPTFPREWVVLSRPWLSSLLPEDEISADVGALSPAGFVLLITSAESESHADGKAVLICDDTGSVRRKYSGFSAYVRDLQQTLAERTQPEYLACQPGFHRHSGGVLSGSGETFDLEEFRRRLIETLAFHRILETVPESAFQGRGGADSRRGNAALADQIALYDSPGTDSGNQQSHADFETRRREQQARLRAGHAPETDLLDGIVLGLEAQTETAADADRQLSDASEEEHTRTWMETLIRERREFLHQQGGCLPTGMWSRDSSSRRSLVLPEFLESGRVLLTPVASPQALPEMVGLLADWGVSPAQHVTLIQAESLRSRPTWLVTWVADHQSAYVEQGWYRRTHSTPHWLLAGGEAPREFWPRWQNLLASA